MRQTPLPSDCRDEGSEPSSFSPRGTKVKKTIQKKKNTHKLQKKHKQKDFFVPESSSYLNNYTPSCSTNQQRSKGCLGNSSTVSSEDETTIDVDIFDGTSFTNSSEEGSSEGQDYSSQANKQTATPNGPIAPESMIDNGNVQNETEIKKTQRKKIKKTKKTTIRDSAKLKKKNYLLYAISLISGTMPEYTKLLNKLPKVLKIPICFFDAVLRGSGQVVFLNNPISGFLILLGLFVHSPWVGLCAFFGLFMSTLFAKLIGVNHSLVSCGLYGYNGILCGAAIATYSDEEWDLANLFGLTGLAGIFCVFLTISLGNFLAPWKIPAFTLPFNFSTFLLVAGAYKFNYYDLNLGGGAVITKDADYEFNFEVSQFFQGIFKGVGQVFFVDSIEGSVIILLGIFVCSRISGIFAVVGSFVGFLIGLLLGADLQELYMGLWGYNSVLGTIAIGGMFYVLNLRSGFLAVCCSAVCAVVFGGLKIVFLVWGVPALTFPFCVGAIIFMLLQGSLPYLVPVDLGSMTFPEDHLNFVDKNNVDRNRKRKIRSKVTSVKSNVGVKMKKIKNLNVNDNNTDFAGGKKKRYEKAAEEIGKTKK